MNEGTSVYIGLDVHKDTITITGAEAGRAPARFIGTIAHDVGKLLKALGKLGRHQQVHVVYEAGPTCYGLQAGIGCQGLRV